MNGRPTAVALLAACVLFSGSQRLPAQDKEKKPISLQRVFKDSVEDHPYDLRHFRCSPEVICDKSGHLRLVSTTLFADETGATDHQQMEFLTNKVWAKKIFVLPSAKAADATLYVYDNPTEVRFNGRLLESSRLESTGWRRLPVPKELLKEGENEVIFADGGALLFEPSRHPGRSFKSTDGGKTWSKTNLGRKENQQGEYVARLRLGAHPSRGWAISPPIDLWPDDRSFVATPGKLVSFDPLKEKTPAGTSLAAWLRTGPLPAPEAPGWTDWVALDKEYVVDEEHQGHRFAQIKLDFRSDDPAATPLVRPGFALQYQFLPDAGFPADEVALLKATPDPTNIARPSLPFVYQEPSPRLRRLREKYELDKVIKPGETELEQLMLLRHWVRNQWHTGWQGGSSAWMPPWDAHIILESREKAECLTMCTHYAAVFVQCCLALGWNARHCILDHHCVAEVWVDDLRKWVMMDAGNSKKRPDLTLHFVDRHQPEELSALQVHWALVTGRTDSLRAVFTPAPLAAKIESLCTPPPKGEVETRPATATINDLPKLGVTGIENYRRFALPERNNYLDTLLPGELYQGRSPYFYDGYYWVGPAPEYSLHLPDEQPAQIDWPVNWTKAHLSKTAKAGELQVDLENYTPNFARFERWIPNENLQTKGTWEKTPARFIWKLDKGDNQLRVRAVNRWDRGGKTDIDVHWTPAK